MKTWQTLLIQAFNQTPVMTSQKSHCGLFNLHGFIYRALSSAGIENRTPFSLWQLLVIRFQSRGNPLKTQQLCIEYVTRMKNPVYGFHANALIIGLIAILLSSIIMLTPKTATTFKTKTNGASILKQVPASLAEIDPALIELPSSGDYQMPTESISYLTSQKLDTNNSLAGEHWILQQPDNSFSLQLVSSSSDEHLQKYCEKYGICDNSAIYHTQVNGKKIVRFLHGVFPSYALAKQAKKQLPLELQKTNPWARQFKRIKQEL